MANVRIVAGSLSSVVAGGGHIINTSQDNATHCFRVKLMFCSVVLMPLELALALFMWHISHTILVIVKNCLVERYTTVQVCHRLFPYKNTVSKINSSRLTSWFCESSSGWITETLERKEVQNHTPGTGHWLKLTKNSWTDHESLRSACSNFCIGVLY